MSFRSTQNCKRYEYVSVDLQNPIQLPVNNANQKKTGYKFTVASTHDSTPMDWFNAYFEVDLKVTKMDNTHFAATDNISIINGGFSMINQITVNFDGVKVLDSLNTNHAVNIKNLVDYSSPYATSVGPTQFHYLDTSAEAVSLKYPQLVLDGNAQRKDITVQAGYNEGFSKRQTLTKGGAVNNMILPLNRFGFFESFRDQIAPNGKVTFEMRLESDTNVIFRANGVDPGRYLITKFVLWVPKMTLSGAGQKLFVEKYLKPHTWTYLKEKIETAPFTQQSAKFRITSSIRKPRHLFVWVLNTTKFSNQEQNMFVFNTYNIADARTITSAQLELSNGVFYPERIMNPTAELAKTYRELIEYNKDFNNYMVGPTISQKSFKDLYGILYFDLSHQDTMLKEGDTKLELRFQLSNTPNAEYNLYALILNEEEVSVDVMSGKAILKT